MTKIKYVHTEQLHNTNAAETVLPFVFQLTNPSTVIDFGCGTGSWLKVAKSLGATSIQGVDGIHVNQELMLINENEFLQHDFTKPLQLNEKFDLAISLEVAEHLPENAADTFVATITRHSDFVLFGAAVPGQEGQYHINEQWPDYWQKKFLDHDFLMYDLLRSKFWNNENVDWWYRQNMFCFARRGHEKFSSLEPVDKVRIEIHPVLYQQIIDQRDYFREKFKNPRLMSSIKNVIKAIIGRKN
jgi:SAM-dependent methyltransferase